MNIKAVVCWIRGQYRTWEYFMPLSGHDFEEVLTDRDKQVLACSFCGTESTAYYNRYANPEGEGLS